LTPIKDLIKPQKIYCYYMANNINWGESYCNSWWGNSSNQSAIDNDSKPECMD